MTLPALVSELTLCWQAEIRSRHVPYITGLFLGYEYTHSLQINVNMSEVYFHIFSLMSTTKW
jgi:hypothetical protein